MRDKGSDEVSRTLNVYGSYKKHADRGYDANKRFEKTGDKEPGFPDATFIAACGGAYIETKNGEGAYKHRFPFVNWRPNQREWWLERCVPKGIPYWLFIRLGMERTHEKYPRIAVLVDAHSFLRIEAACPDKSLSYEEVLCKYPHFLLEWVKGGSRFSIPITHPFYARLGLWSVII